MDGDFRVNEIKFDGDFREMDGDLGGNLLVGGLMG